MTHTRARARFIQTSRRIEEAGVSAQVYMYIYMFRHLHFRALRHFSSRETREREERDIFNATKPNDGFTSGLFAECAKYAEMCGAAAEMNVCEKVSVRER